MFDSSHKKNSLMQVHLTSCAAYILGMDEVVPQVWIGELPSCLSGYELKKARITVVVSCEINPSPLLSAISEIDNLNVPVDDVDDAPLFIYFGQTHRFITEHLESSSNANVLVCCQPGSSCSVTVSYNPNTTDRRSASHGAKQMDCQASARPYLQARFIRNAKPRIHETVRTHKTYADWSCTRPNRTKFTYQHHACVHSFCSKRLP